MEAGASARFLCAYLFAPPSVACSNHVERSLAIIKMPKRYVRSTKAASRKATSRKRAYSSKVRRRYRRYKRKGNAMPFPIFHNSLMGNSVVSSRFPSNNRLYKPDAAAQAAYTASQAANAKEYEQQFQEHRSQIFQDRILAGAAGAALAPVARYAGNFAKTAVSGIVDATHLWDLKYLPGKAARWVQDNALQRFGNAEADAREEGLLGAFETPGRMLAGDVDSPIKKAFSNVLGNPFDPDADMHPPGSDERGVASLMWDELKEHGAGLKKAAYTAGAGLAGAAMTAAAPVLGTAAVMGGLTCALDSDCRQFVKDTASQVVEGVHDTLFGKEEASSVPPDT